GEEEDPAHHVLYLGHAPQRRRAADLLQAFAAAHGHDALAGRGAGRDRVDGDAVRAELDRQRAREVVDAGLGRGVGRGGRRPRADARDRADADDAPAALALEGGDGGLDAEEHRLEIEIDDAIPFLLGRFLYRVEPREASRAVDEDVVVTRLAVYAIECTRDLRGAGRVGGDERGLPAALADRARGDLAGLVVHGR